jgi:hypothetical protein
MARSLLLQVPQAPGKPELPLGKVATSLAIGLVLGGLTCCGLMTLQDRVTRSAPAQPHGVVQP